MQNFGNINKFEFLKTKPFLIFKFNNFLDEKQFSQLFNEIIDYKHLDLEKLVVEDNKIAISSRKDYPYENYFKKKLYLSKLIDFFESNKAKKYFLKSFKYHFLMSKLLSIITLIMFKEKISINNRIKQLLKNTFIFLKHLFKILFNFQNLDTKIEVSIIKQNGFIVPHTDSKSKFISLMLYFPKYFKDHKLFLKEQSLGTIFYESKISGNSNPHLKNEDQKNFFDKSILSLQLPFEKFHLYGFLRNPYSWHEVKKIQIEDGYERISVNINYHIT